MKIQEEALSTTQGTKERHMSKHSVATILFLGLCTLCAVGLYLIEVIPRYTTISIIPPEDSYDLVNWSSTTKSVWATQTTPSVRAFIWRKDATLSYENVDDIPSWDSLVLYFSEHLNKQGWEKSNSSTSCSLYLPEAAFLPSGENGFISFHRVGAPIYNDGTSEGDVVCLAVWNNKGHANVFRLVLLTVKESFFTNILSVFEL